MKKITTFMLLAAALLVSVPSWAYVPGEQKTFKELGLPLIIPDVHGTYFGTICVPQRIVATQGIRICDVICVDVEPKDTTKVARLVVDVHPVCDPAEQGPDSYDETWCPNNNPDPCNGKAWIDWETFENYLGEKVEHRMVAGAAYFYQVCDYGADSLADRKIWVDKNDSASAPVCQNGFYGTFEQTNLNEPVTVLTQATMKLPSGKDTTTQYLEQVTQVTMPANRGYFKGNFECVPWRWNTFSKDFTEEFQKEHGVTTSINPLHYPCSNAPAVPRRVSSSAIAFNVGRNVATGLYQVDFEHPIYLNQDTNKRIENGQLIIEAADGTKYNAFGQKLR